MMNHVQLHRDCDDCCEDAHDCHGCHDSHSPRTPPTLTHPAKNPNHRSDCTKINSRFLIQESQKSNALSKILYYFQLIYSPPKSIYSLPDRPHPLSQRLSEIRLSSQRK